MLRAGQTASAPLRRKGELPCHTRVADDKDDIGRLIVALLIHADLCRVIRNTVRERGYGLAVGKNHFQESLGLLPPCAVVAQYCYATNLYERLGVHRPFL